MNHRPAYLAGQSDPCENRQFRRRWAVSDANTPAVELISPNRSDTPSQDRISPARAKAEREWQALAREAPR